MEKESDYGEYLTLCWDKKYNSLHPIREERFRKLREKYGGVDI